MKHVDTLILATRNQHKIHEIEQILGPALIYRSLSDYVAVQIPETGQTLFENSMAKARFAHKISTLPALADDSGLFINALDGEPGIYSARFGSNDEQRIARVLDKLQNEEERRAHFEAVFVLMIGADEYQMFEGICSGTIANEPRGTHGFGYDPIFIPHGYTRTFAELGAEVKNKISHRALALKQLKEYLGI
ncbi:RdgB/HAM1 family non-canonical purine NTP pyrophosphatase [candidate division WOR-3 bacterium]|nr:RdgB/HAM1 family non-canonical purine NTP pyrophosphatase [candidate division WOR-3 bacterium]